MLVNQPATSQLTHFGGRIDHPHGDIGGRLFDRGGGLAPKGLPVDAIDKFDQDGFSGGTPTIRSEDDAESLGIGHVFDQMRRLTRTGSHNDTLDER